MKIEQAKISDASKIVDINIKVLKNVKIRLMNMLFAK